MKQTPEKFTKPYNAQATEDRIYDLWEQSGYFNPDNCVADGICAPDAEHFSIVLPPPNVTGQLHLGHAFEDSTQDAIIRFNRMRGKKTLWVPGTDHAAIATQSKFEKELLKKEKKSRHDFTREDFFAMVQEFALGNQTTILSQLKKMGASLDWSRLCFTLDDERANAVTCTFKKMYDAGLIYQKHRIVNWDPKGQTTISDDEVVREERASTMYTFKYSHDFPFPIATTRPETKLGDTAVAVHPDDARYKEYVGKSYSFNFAGEDVTVRIVADTAVDPEFGVGALGVTPAHAIVDWEIAERHDLPIVQVINEYGKMMLGNETIINTKTEVARESVVAWLRQQGLMIKEEAITQNVATAERTGAVIEPLPKLQWWIDVNKKFAYPHDTLAGISQGQQVSLKDLMLHVVETGMVDIMPERFDKTYRHWVENLRDWNISRQILYGHRVPVWYDENKSIHTAFEQKFIFMRHGETEHNLEDIFQGQTDSPLTEKGLAQAYETAQKLKDAGITKIISSDLGRAQKTAEIVAAELGLEIEYWSELREIDTGELTGIKGDGRSLLEQILEHKTGETLEQLEDRARQAIDKLKALTTDKNILVVGHNNFTSIIFAVWHNIPREHFLTKRKQWLLGNTETESLVIMREPVGENLIQDTDTLDTWFSSGLWSFSTLGWPNSSHDLAEFHPTNLLNPGYEILPLWVSRMILMSTFLVGQIPFKTTYIHGMLRDNQGRKFSKSLDNGIDPLQVIEQFGTDALRMALTIGVAPGQDMNFDLQKVKAYSKFSNKIWNATRFVLDQVSSFEPQVSSSDEVTNDKDKEYMREFDAMVTELTKEMEAYKCYIVAEKLYHYFWHTFADNIIEDIKQRLYDSTISEQDKKSGLVTLLKLLTGNLKLLHPFMPFLTEEIWQSLPDEIKTNNLPLFVQKWPLAQ
jgi:valyl-tRNA synthetase